MTRAHSPFAHRAGRHSSRPGTSDGNVQIATAGNGGRVMLSNRHRTRVATASRLTDAWLRPLAALTAPLALWVSLHHCGRTWSYCGEWGCATGVSGPGCTTVAGVGVEPWALGVVALATAVCVFGGVHRA